MDNSGDSGSDTVAIVGGMGAEESAAEEGAESD